MGHVKREWQDRDAILLYFGKTKNRSIEKYEQFIEDEVKAGNRPELVGGGLVRSLGGWSQVLSSRRSSSKIFSDERILGSSEFVKDIISEAEERDKETLRLNTRISDLRSLAKDVCKEEEVEEADLRGGGKRKAVVKARKIFCQIAVKKMGYSGADTARFLGITTSAVNRLAVSEELPEVMKFMQVVTEPTSYYLYERKVNDYEKSTHNADNQCLSITNRNIAYDSRRIPMLLSRFV